MISNELSRNAELSLCMNRYIIHEYYEKEKSHMSNLEKQKDLMRLKDIAVNFDKEERQVVLSCIPIDELIDSLKVKCNMMMDRIEQVQSLVDEFNK